MKSVSSGVLVFDPAGRLLLGHANESRYWDIPKGEGAVQEQGAQTAVREAFEECGLRLSPGQLREIGLFEYRRDKELRLFAVLVNPFEAKRCVCTSFYTDRHGRRYPEMNGFRWAQSNELPQLCAPSLVAVLTQAISLPAIHGQLLYEVGAVDAAPAPRDARVA
ncbi:8-oxo-dGTP pyrophosphatase MutT (NUDIX family) [Variovorax boronicumulans]|uniref:NUDIX hydrolase n=1 Tax=Variovorax boronicumulans TaxID=436515 RepID=UPI002782DDA1|nr:NUDIX domain-containing protein [Variovorax boronicumulans]MDQ0036890.1 8-oxo-dGTP pyrophosphatase MutT (NUDIX family) [Variovorax boronicumulans]